MIYDRLTKKVIYLNARDETDLYVMRQIFDNNDYGFEKLSRQDELQAHYENIIAQRLVPLIIDCGAHCGIATKYFSETYPRARIVALEPDPSNFEAAQKNNNQGNISILCAAVGNSDGFGNLDRNDGSWAHRVHGDERGKTKIISINGILADECRLGANPFIVKIDIEGFEENLFEKNTQWIDAFPVLIIELHDWMLPRSASSGNFLREIGKRNRDFAHFGENVFSISGITI